MPTDANYDQDELDKFNALAASWWDTQGQFRALHAINSTRVEYIAEHAPLKNAQALDIGCGGGILSEALHIRGAKVTGIDLAQKPLQVARMHASESEYDIEYRSISTEALAQEAPESYDLVCCMEMLEHVPVPADVVRSAVELIRPGGHLFFATINRNAWSWMSAIVAAEYILGVLPRGTHEYVRLIRPDELASWVRASGANVCDIIGQHYNPFTHTGRLTRSVAVNYILHAQKPE